MSKAPSKSSTSLLRYVLHWGCGKGTLTAGRPKIYPEFPLRALGGIANGGPSSCRQGIDTDHQGSAHAIGGVRELPEEAVGAVSTRMENSAFE